MNPLASLIASLTGTTATNGPGAGITGEQQPGLFAQLLGDAGADGEPLLASLGPVGETPLFALEQNGDNPAIQPAALFAAGEKGLPVIEAAAALAPQAAVEGDPVPGTVPAPETVLPLTQPNANAKDGETKQAGGGQQDTTASPPVAEDALPENAVAPPPYAVPIALPPEAKPVATATVTPASAQPNPAVVQNVQPQATPAAPSPAPAAAVAGEAATLPGASAQGTPQQPADSGQARVAEPGASSTQPQARPGQTVNGGEQATVNEGSRRAENGGETTPRGERPGPSQIVRTTVNPVSGQALLHVAERSSGDGQPTSALDSGINTVHLRAAGGPVSAAATAQSAAQQTPQIPLNNLAVHIAQQARNGSNRFDIRLDPPELGRLEIRLDVRRDGHVTTHLVVERAETLDLLQRDARGLERALQNAGLNTSEGGLSFSLKGQGQQNTAADQSNVGTAQSGDSGDEQNTSDAHDEAAQTGQLYTASGGLDIRI